MESRIYKPRYPLADFVDSFFMYTGKSYGAVQKLIPDGKTDLLMNFDTRVYAYDSPGKESLFSKSIVQGIRTAPYTFEFGEQVNLLGIRFLPFGLYALFGTAEKEITDYFTEASEIAGSGMKETEEKVYNEPDVNMKFRIIEKWLTECLIKRVNNCANITDNIRKISSSEGLVKLSEVCSNEANYKKVQRIFRDYIGISPKLYARMVRFENIHNELRACNTPDWIEIVTRYNFFDQSHLIKEFKFFSDTTPNDFLAKINLFV
jgi:AraC-like DNA-binding protein